MPLHIPRAKLALQQQSASMPCARGPVAGGGGAAPRSAGLGPGTASLGRRGGNTVGSQPVRQRQKSHRDCIF